VSDQYLKFVREELKSSMPIQVPPLRLASLIQAARKALLELHTLDAVGKEITKATVDRLVKDAELLAKIRFLKTILRQHLEVNSIDSEVARALIALLRVERDLFSPVVVRLGERVLYRFTSNCHVGDKFYRKGEVAPLSVREVILAEINGCGNTLIDPIYRFRLVLQ